MRTYGLIGKSLGHSFSAGFFKDFFEKNGVDAEYRNFELPEIQEISRVFDLHPSGLNVTIPYKESVIPFLDELSEEACAISAVNCIQFLDGKKIGHNTDAYGFQQSVKPFLTFHHERALVLGTGGASKAVAFVLKNIGIDVLTVSRSPEGTKQFAYKDVNEHMLRACKLVVNCTPVGTHPAIHDVIPFPFDHLSSEHLVVHLIYNPAKTRFLELAEQAGATILNGESMLQHQALRSWKIWNEDTL
jgi:shikimate dehydrogenase